MPPTAPAPAHTAACASIPSTPPHHPSSAAPLPSVGKGCRR